MGFNGNMGFVSPQGKLNINVSQEEINASNYYETNERYCLLLTNINEYYKQTISEEGVLIVETTPQLEEAWSSDNINVIFKKSKDLSTLNFNIRIIDKNQ